IREPLARGWARVESRSAPSARAAWRDGNARTPTYRAACTGTSASRPTSPAAGGRFRTPRSRADDAASGTSEPYARTRTHDVELSDAAMSDDLHLTQRELDIMSVLWDLGEATVTEVRDRVDPELAYTSISSMIRTLELKGYVSHRRGEGKTHIYFPAIDAETAGESTLSRVLNKLYGGAPTKKVAAHSAGRPASGRPLGATPLPLKNPPPQRHGPVGPAPPPVTLSLWLP